MGKVIFLKTQDKYLPSFCVFAPLKQHNFHLSSYYHINVDFSFISDTSGGKTQSRKLRPGGKRRNHSPPSHDSKEVVGAELCGPPHLAHVLTLRKWVKLMSGQNWHMPSSLLLGLPTGSQPMKHCSLIMLLSETPWYLIANPAISLICDKLTNGQLSAQWPLENFKGY